MSTPSGMSTPIPSSAFQRPARRASAPRGVDCPSERPRVAGGDVAIAARAAPRSASCRRRRTDTWHLNVSLYAPACPRELELRMERGGGYGMSFEHADVSLSLPRAAPGSEGAATPAHKLARRVARGHVGSTETGGCPERFPLHRVAHHRLQDLLGTLKEMRMQRGSVKRGAQRSPSGRKSL